MPIPEDTLRAMEKASQEVRQRNDSRLPHPVSGFRHVDPVFMDPINVLALIAAYRKQGRGLVAYAKTMNACGIAGNEDGKTIVSLRESIAAATVAASARIDEIAALTAERDEARALLPEEMPGCKIKYVECERGQYSLCGDDLRHAHALLAEIEAALQPKETPDVK